ncbi:NAD(P)H-dependent oxidoreductase [Arenicella xantha]|uniref:NAD(P)H dehydrogenase (Quinone) n=1 Tax=Arenicella xantha TaxID=644221 RepID=A0A395JJY3_9GAMM|nr:NAD(P)H-dependent oxidoreductase [Arenicella xantha]RBP51086.1 NAD(P)H dehydrogenase (quinone) [Arenicella xantha]
MNHLIVFAHPNNESLNSTLLYALEMHLKRQDHTVKTRNLYELKFDPVLSLSDMQGQRIGQVAEEVALEQDFIRWADCITFIHPIWWTGLPAIFKGYIDRVFSYGFAYCYEAGKQHGLLSGKQAVVINTHGKSQPEYQAIGMDKALALTSDVGIYNYCGMALKRHLYFDNADRATRDTIEQWINHIESVFA